MTSARHGDRLSHQKKRSRDEATVGGAFPASTLASDAPYFAWNVVVLGIALVVLGYLFSRHVRIGDAPRAFAESDDDQRRR